MKWSFLSGDVNWEDYGGKFVSGPMTDSDYPVWYVIDVVNMHDACGRDATSEYCVELSVVSPGFAGEDGLRQAAESWSLTPDEVGDGLMAIEVLHSYGLKAVVWSGDGDQLKPLLREAKRFAKTDLSIFFGFILDRPTNGVGTTGWEAMAGDLESGITRTIASDSTEGQILGKMYGVR